MITRILRLASSFALALAIVTGPALAQTDHLAMAISEHKRPSTMARKSLTHRLSCSTATTPSTTR